MRQQGKEQNRGRRTWIKHMLAATMACSLMAGLPLSVSAAGKAAAWPTKPIRIVVPFTPGGSNDHIARRLAQSLSQSLGTTVVVENRGGAAGVVGSAMVANSPPDGYTFLFVSASLATSAATQNPPYDTLKAFDAVARVAQAPFVMLVRKDFPAQTLGEFIEYAKAHPGQINYGTTGSGDSGHLLTELFSSLVGLKMQQVGYKGVNPAQMDLLAGRLDFMITTLASINGTQAAELPKLAFTGTAREPGFPSVPTVREVTQLDYEPQVWWAVLAPSGTPEPVLDKMNAEVTRIVAMSDFQTFLAGLGATAAPSDRAAMNAQLKHDVEVFTQTAKRSGISVAQK
ncbi:tripartite tricarboxylate transporter substrate binding protein [Bordetella sp. 15P40C-2]|uniref:Bug family tripartite tricarboxylate transporter substrate binding protein n=1 Tax=Bordetella sp. 15P40C-2 TaxID=2572246 RepID=UPI0013262918|nr:tripartite tricarboxylate transporter substrate binding protein [Bordetella sp. 15P40C-2]MVW70420.1 tripartite tricarboxylate transporter substrate binding protein [Bordetella sp. 15P40C-2]